MNNVILFQEYQLKGLLDTMHRLESSDIKGTVQFLVNIGKQSKIPAESPMVLFYKLKLLLGFSTLENEQGTLAIDYVSAWQRQDFDYIHTHTATAIEALKNSEDYFDECLALLESVELDITRLCFM